MGHRKAYDGPDQPCYIRVMTIAIAHHWQPITDLPENWQVMADPTLPVLAEEWRKGREAVGDSSEIRRFNAELLREVAIETGLIEGLYSIDRGTTETLIRMGLIKEELAQGIIDRSPDEIMPILEDQHSATEGLFDFVKQKRDLDISYIKELHAHLTRHQPSTTALTTDGRRVEIPLLRGEWKAQPNNPRREDGSIHEYCPPEHVATEMDRLVEMHLAHEAAGVAPDVSAAWLHHRFTQIHPFQDGNGRVARSLASLVFLRAGWFILNVSRDERDNYIRALETADAGNDQDLFSLFGKIQGEFFSRAIDVLGDLDIKSIIKKSIRENLNHDIDIIFSDIIEVTEKYFKSKPAIVSCDHASLLYNGLPTPANTTIRLFAHQIGRYRKDYLGGFIYLDKEGRLYPYTFNRGDRSNVNIAIERGVKLGELSQLSGWVKLQLRFLILEWERHR